MPASGKSCARWPPYLLVGFDYSAGNIDSQKLAAGGAAPVSGGLISHRSQLEGQPTTDGHLFLTYKYTRNVELPGLVVHLLEGPSPLPSDTPFGDHSLLFASEARGLLENLQPARVRKGGVSKALPLENVEERLKMVLRIRGEEGLNALRDQARAVAAALNWPTELATL